MEDTEAATRTPQQEKDHKKLISTTTMTTTNQTKKNKRRRCICICIWITAVIVAIGLLFLILGLTVFKAKRPSTTVDSIALSDLDFSIDIARVRALINVTLAVNLTINNPNRVGFRYTDSNAILRYRGNDVGVVPIPAGRIGARDSRGLNLTLTVMADRLLTDSGIYSDALSGTLPFQTYVRMKGKVRILFNINVVAYATCDVQVSLANRAVSDQQCRYRTRL